MLTSAAGCRTLTKQILPPRLHNSPALNISDALMLWSSTTLESPPTSPPDVHQRAWDDAQISAILNSLLEKATDPAASRARLLGVSTKESGAWLNAPPVSSLGLRMDDDTVTICVGLRLGVNLCRSHPYQQCGMPVDEKARHASSCRKSQGRHSRHNSVNDIIYRSLSVAGVPCQVEPHGLSRADGKRPDEVTLLPWRSGLPLIWDATCSDTFAQSACERGRAVADLAET